MQRLTIFSAFFNYKEISMVRILILIIENNSMGQGDFDITDSTLLKKRFRKQPLQQAFSRNSVTSKICQKTCSF